MRETGNAHARLVTHASIDQLERVMPKSNIKRGIMMAGAMGASAGLGIAVGASGSAASASPQTAAASIQPRSTAVHSRQPGSLAEMVESVGPAVVQIQVQQPNGGRFDEGFGSAAARPGTSGSGFVIDPSGVVVTNNHVVQGGGEVLVKLADGTELPGRVVGTDSKTDLAVVKVSARTPLKAVRWGNSDTARVGEDVFAVGSPFGLGNSVTAGIISARGREIGAGPYDDFLQVDASINSGNSGGPLFDGQGAVIGVNTAILSPTGGNIGIGFAIPSRLAQSVIRQILENGEVRRGQISVLLQPLTPEIASQLGLPEPRGALIADVDPAGTGAAAGLKPGDVVVSLRGKPVADSRQFARAVAEADIGSRVALVIVRNGRKLPLSVDIANPRDG